MSGSSWGECSRPGSSRSRPAPAATAVAAGLARLIHKPICGVPDASARLKRFCGMSLRMSVDLPLGDGGAAGEEIEVAAGLGFAHMLVVKPPLAALGPRVPHDPFAAPPRHVGPGHRPGQPPRRDPALR